MTRTEADLSVWLRERGVAHEILVAKNETPTIEAAARELGVPAERIVKSVLFERAGEHVLVLARGGTRVDTKALGPGAWRLADAATVERVTGYAAGTVPPVGHATPVRVVMDAAVHGLDEMVAGGGGPRASLRIATADVERLTAARVANVAR